MSRKWGNQYCTPNFCYISKNVFKTSNRLLFILLRYFSNLKKKCVFKSIENMRFFNAKLMRVQNRRSCFSVYERYTNADLKISPYVCVHITTIPWKFCFLNPKNSPVFALKFVNFLKSRLVFILFYCFWMFLERLFP